MFWNCLECTRASRATPLSESLSEQIKRAQTIAGQLLWIAGRTRPDIPYAVSMVGQLVTRNPSEAVSQAQTRHTSDLSLVYGKAPCDYGEWDQLKYKRHSGLVEAYADASLAADSDCKSFGAAHLHWAGSLACWLSQRQPLIGASTAEAELVALTEAHALSRAMQPTVRALLRDHLVQVEPMIYTDMQQPYVGRWSMEDASPTPTWKSCKAVC